MAKKERVWAHYTDEEMKERNKKNWIADWIAIIILVACMFAMVIVLPILLGGAHDASGTPIEVIAIYADAAVAQAQNAAAVLL